MKRSLDKVKIVFFSSAVLTTLLVIFLLGFILFTAAPVLIKEGFGFITSPVWNYETHQYGISVFIIGTLILTLVTMMIACPLGILTAIYLTEWAPVWLEKLLKPLIELLVGIPSVVYGLFGFYVLGYIFRDYVNPVINSAGGWLPVFQNVNPSSTSSILLASTVLAIMVLPTIVALSMDAIYIVPEDYREASLSLGATKWETIRNVVLPTASGGIITSFILGMMRAMGETMAVVMLIGNSMAIPSSILGSGYTMTSKILNDISFYIADNEPRSALFAIAAVLFVIEMGFVGVVRVTCWYFSEKTT
jgi:phosphate transport system permease protein